MCPRDVGVSFWGPSLTLLSPGGQVWNHLLTGLIQHLVTFGIISNYGVKLAALCKEKGAG